MPVTICYDRILEMRNLAGEMISEEARDHSVMDIFNLLRNLKQDQLGSIFVNFGEPLSLASYLNQDSTLTEASLQLDKDLVKSHFARTPVCLNMIVASLLLQQQGSQKIFLSSFVKYCAKLYIYMRKRNINTMMTLEPSSVAVERSLKGMGFSIKSLP